MMQTKLRTTTLGATRGRPNETGTNKVKKKKMEAVPRMPMLSFELKHSLEYVEFGPTLKQYIRDHYGEDPALYNKACNDLESLRQSAVHVSHDFMGCSTLKKYYAQLQFLQGRFPMTEGGEAAIPFTWEDIHSGREVMLEDIKFEQACILYNIGSLHSVLGSMDTRQSADGMKVSCTHFQCSAWAFEHLRDHFGCAAMSLDMSHELLTFQANLMLAQAQECILEKSMTDSRKSTITAKVSAQIVEFYRTSAKHLETCHTEELIASKRYKEWKKRIEVKILFYTCITNFYQGRQSEDQQKWGECLAYYTVAQDKLNECSKVAKSEVADIQESLRFTMDVVGGKYQAAKKDNDFVYHEKIPVADSLPEVKGASLVKGIPFNPADPEVSGPDIFLKLVPMSAHEASSLYSEEKASLLRRICSEIAEKDEELTQYLASLQLDSTKLNPEPERLPQQLLEKCAAISVRPNAIKDLIESMGAVSNAATEVDLGLKEIEQLLEEEKESEAEYQKNFGKRAPNIILSEIEKESKMFEEGHKKGSQSNNDLHKAMNTYINNLKLLSSPLEDLQKMLPSVEKDPENDDIVQNLNKLLNKVEEMRIQRQTLEEQLRKEVQADDITNVLCTREDVSKEALFAEQIKKHDKTITFLKQNLGAQDNILRALTDANARYASIRKSTGETLAKREQMIRDLINSYDVYEDLLAKSQKGLEFYKKLETNVGRLLTRCRSVVKVQQEERDQVMNRYKPKAPAPSRPAAAAPKPEQSDPTSPQPSSLPTMFEGPKLKDYLPFMKPKTFGKKDGSPPATVDPSVQAYIARTGGSLPNIRDISPVHLPQASGSHPGSPVTSVQSQYPDLAPKGPVQGQGPRYRTPGAPQSPIGSGGQMPSPTPNQQAVAGAVAPTPASSSSLQQIPQSYSQFQPNPYYQPQSKPEPPQSPVIEHPPRLPQSHQQPQLPPPQPTVQQPQRANMAQNQVPNAPGMPYSRGNALNQGPGSASSATPSPTLPPDLQQQQHPHGPVAPTSHYQPTSSPQPSTASSQGLLQPVSGVSSSGNLYASEGYSTGVNQQQQWQQQQQQQQQYQHPGIQNPQSPQVQSSVVQGQIQHHLPQTQLPGVSTINANQPSQQIPNSVQPSVQQPYTAVNQSSAIYSSQISASFTQQPVQLHGKAAQSQPNIPFQQQYPGVSGVSGVSRISQHIPHQPAQYPSTQPGIPPSLNNTNPGYTRNITNTVSTVETPVISPGNDGRLGVVTHYHQNHGQVAQQQLPQTPGQQLTAQQSTIQQPVSSVEQYQHSQQFSPQAGPQYQKQPVQYAQQQQGQLQQQPIQQQLPTQFPQQQLQQPSQQPVQAMQQQPQQLTQQGQLTQPMAGGQVQPQIQNQNQNQQMLQQSTGALQGFPQQPSGQQLQQPFQSQQLSGQSQQQSTVQPSNQQQQPISAAGNHYTGQQQYIQPQQSVGQLQQPGGQLQQPRQTVYQQGYSQSQGVLQQQQPAVNIQYTGQTGPGQFPGGQQQIQQTGQNQNIGKGGQPAMPYTGQQQYQAGQQPVHLSGQGGLPTVQQGHQVTYQGTQGVNMQQGGELTAQGQMPTSGMAGQGSGVISGVQMPVSGYSMHGTNMTASNSGYSMQGTNTSAFTGQAGVSTSQGPGMVQGSVPVNKQSYSNQPQFSPQHASHAQAQTVGIYPTPLQGTRLPPPTYDQTATQPALRQQSQILNQPVGQHVPQQQYQSPQRSQGQGQPQGPPVQYQQTFPQQQTPQTGTMPPQQFPNVQQHYVQNQQTQQQQPLQSLPPQTAPQGLGQTYGMQGQGHQGQGSLPQQPLQPSVLQQQSQSQQSGSNQQTTLKGQGHGQGQIVNQQQLSTLEKDWLTSVPDVQPVTQSSQFPAYDSATSLQPSRVGSQSPSLNTSSQDAVGKNIRVKVKPQDGSVDTSPIHRPGPQSKPVMIKSTSLNDASPSHISTSHPQSLPHCQLPSTPPIVERQTSTASSLDEILSSSLDGKTDVKTESVLAPKVLTAQEIQQQKEDQMKNSSLRSHNKDPYKEKSKLDKFVLEVEKLAKFIEGMDKPSCSGPTPLDLVQKEIMEEQEKAGRQQSLAIARCYPMKNRDQDIMPYDKTRVLLTSLDDDYINSSWINDLSPNCPKFIATQAPLGVTLVDFWLMIYEQGVEVLVALSAAIETGKKFPVYWPQGKGEVLHHGPVTLTLQSVKETQGWTERILYLTHTETKLGRTVVHLHYSDWPVSGFPDKVSHVLQFITEVHCFYRQQRSLMKPIVVHCSNGIGRTGMFMLIYAGMQHMSCGEGIINIPVTAAKMVSKRRNILIKKDQLRYCYDSILYYAKDILAKQGILVHKASFGDKLPGPGEKTHLWEPTEDILFGSMSLMSLQSSVAKLGVKRSESPVSEKDKSSKADESQVKQTESVSVSTTEESQKKRVSSSGSAIDSKGFTDKAKKLTVLPDVVQNPNQSHDILPSNSNQDNKDVDMLSDIGSPAKSVEGSIKNASGTGSREHSPMHQPSKSASPEQTKSKDGVSSSLSQLQDPNTFTIGTSDTSKKKITKADFLDTEKDSARKEAQTDPSDPLSSLDPFWSLK